MSKTIISRAGFWRAAALGAAAWFGAGASLAQTKAPQPAQANTRPAAAAPERPAPSGTDDFAVKSQEIVARVGDKDITAGELRASFQLLDQRQLAALANDPGLLSQTVRAILAGRLVLKEALAKKWDQQPAVAAQIARARDNVIVESYLQSVTEPPDNFPSEAEIKALYDANATALLLPRRFRLAQIVVGVSKDADKPAQDAAQKKIDDLVKKLKQPGSDFGALARSASDDTGSAERDGDIGWVPEPELRSELRGQVAGLPKGGIADPIRLDDGWHIVKLIDTEPARTRSLDEVKDALVQRLRAERSEANRRAYVQELQKQAPPAVNELALSKLMTKGDASVTR